MIMLLNNKYRSTCIVVKKEEEKKKENEGTDVHTTHSACSPVKKPVQSVELVCFVLFDLVRDIIDRTKLTSGTCHD